MEEYGNNGSYGVNWKQMRAVDGKQEIYLEWPYAFSFLPRAVPEWNGVNGQSNDIVEADCL